MKKIFVRQLQHEKQQQKLIKFVQKVETKQLIRKIGIHFQNKTCKELVEHCCSFEMRGQPSSYTKNCICDAIFCGIYRKLLKNTENCLWYERYLFGVFWITASEKSGERYSNLLPPGQRTCPQKTFPFLFFFEPEYFLHMFLMSKNKH